MPACGPAGPGMTNVPGALAATAKLRFQVGSVPAIDKIPLVRIAVTPLVADQGTLSTNIVIEPFEVESPAVLVRELVAVPPNAEGLAGLLEPQEETLVRVNTAAASPIICLITPPGSQLFTIPTSHVNTSEERKGRT